MKSTGFSKKGNKERVREHRKIRKDAGLREIKLWICESDLKKIYKLLSPFLQRGDKLLKNFRQEKNRYKQII